MMTTAIKRFEMTLLCLLLFLSFSFVLLAGEADTAKKKSAGEALTQAPPETKTKPSAEIKPEAASKDNALDPQASRRTSLVWSATVKVVNPDDIRAQIEKEARLLGGFPMYFNGSSILLKLPPSALSVLTAKIGEMGLVLEKSLNREDITLRIAELQGMLKSKRDILARSRKFLDNSDVAATLEIEQTMTGLVLEIEQLRGSLRVLYDRATFAVVNVSFEFRERDKIVYVQSPFEWLNTVDLGQFIGGF